MKHAFLIMAHNNYKLVGRLLKKLDHPDNTIYIHIDAKSPFSTDDKKMLSDSCKASKVIFTDRYRINWGGYSQINLELRMLEFACAGKYDYYHFLSGVDFPTKSMEYIHSFYEKNAGKEFVYFSTAEFMEREKYRFSRYHFFQEKCNRNNNIYRVIKRGFLLLQKILKTDRTKKYKDIEFKIGSNWVSITHAFVTYLLSKEEQIKKLYSHSFCCDEVFLQTVLYSSPFMDNVFQSKESNITTNLRSVDWQRGDKKIGAPYTYTVSDYEELVNSRNLFCRKVTDLTPEGNALIKKLEQL